MAIQMVDLTRGGSTPPVSPVAAPAEPLCKKALPNKMTNELHHSRFGFDGEFDNLPLAPAHAHSQERVDDDGTLTIIKMFIEHNTSVGLPQDTQDDSYLR